MVDIDDAIIGRLESHGETFEILIDPRVVSLVREGKEIDLGEAAAASYGLEPGLMDS